MRLFILWLFALGTLGAEGPIPWTTDVEVLEQEDREEPTLIYFTASSCPPCEMMKKTTFQDAIWKGMWKERTPLMVDFDEHQNLVHRFSISSVPTLVLVNRFGEEVARHMGFADSPTLLLWLSEWEEAWVSKDSLAERFERSHDEELIALADEEARGEKMAMILSALREKRDREQHEKVLRQFWGLHPDWLKRDLNHSSLVIRVLAARHLMILDRIGAYDPWADEVSRHSSIQTITRWKEEP